MQQTPPPSEKWLVHLSDIHFRRSSTDPHDLDNDIRSELSRDLAEVRGLTGSPLDAFIVTGDIAFSGAGDQYATAQKWLEQLTSVAGCPGESIFVVPGNHDADRDVHDQSLLLQNLHRQFRECKPDEIDAQIETALRDGDAAELLFKPLANYNTFAEQYSCETTPEKPMWEHRLRLNDGSMLLLRGVNSVLVSNSKDNKEGNRLVLGSLQATPKRESGEAVLLACHHPPDWLRDSDTVDAPLKARVHLQLFGHKHKQVIDSLNNSLRIVAGAVHPERREKEWVPRYNVLGVSVVGAGRDRKLRVRLYPRVWNTTQLRFQADFNNCSGEACVEYALDLDDWRPETAEEQSPTNDSPRDTAGVIDRTHRYRFARLPVAERVKLGKELDLIEGDELELEEPMRSRLIRRRALERGVTDQLEKKIDLKYAQAPRKAN